MKIKNMKQAVLILSTIALIVIFSYCSGTKKATQAAPPPITYDANVQQLVAEKCSPCHMPAKGGKKLPLDSYDAVKVNFDDILRRIQLNPGDHGFMPFKNPKLSDSAIQVFKSWQSEGFIK